MQFNNQYINATIEEAVDIASSRISQNYALTCIADKGSCTLEEAQNMYELAHRILTEGQEDLIPENLELPDASDDVDPTAGQDAAVDADLGGDDMDGDLDLSDLEGIILPDSEGNQYIIQNGILVPYEEEDDSDLAGGQGGDTPNDPSTAPADDEDLGEGTAPTEGTSITEGTTVEAIGAIEENTSVFGNNSSVVANLLKHVNFSK